MEDITAACEDVTRDADNNTLYIIHAGTNDVKSCNSEELLDRYRRMIQQYRSKSNNILISGILPRIGAERSFYSKAFSTNNRLKSLCTQENVDYVNLWDDFYNNACLFQNDGLHLNSVGAARLGRLLDEQVSLFRSKNGERTGEAVSP